jgi:hypothetical protein
VQLGGNYYVTMAMRVMANAIIPVDDSSPTGTTFIARLQLGF